MALKESREPRWITIMGASGTGKTHCAKKLWGLASKKLGNSNCDFLLPSTGNYWPDLVDKLKTGNKFDYFNDMKKWPCVFLDDIGADRDNTGFASEKLNTLLGCRVNKWTIITSNLTLEQIGAIDPRISDRIIRKPNIFLEVNTISHSLRK